MKSRAGSVVAWVAASCVAASGAPAETSVSLEEAYRAAIAWHERFAVASAEDRRAAVTGWRAFSAIGPTVTESASFARQKEEIAFPAPPGGPGLPVLPRETTRGTLTVSQPLYTQQFWPLREIGRLAAERSREFTRAVAQDVRFEVAEAYYGVLRAARLRSVAEENLRLSRLEAEHARARLDAGETVRSDVVRVEAEVARAEQRLAEAEGALATARDRLARLTGLQEPFDLEEPSPESEPVPPAETAVARALSSSPEVRQAELAAELARAEMRRRRALLFPTLGLRFQHRLVDEESFADRNDFWDLVLALEIPLVEGGGARLLDLAESRALVARAEAEATAARREVEFAVRRARTDLETLAAKEAAAADEERSADETYRLLSEQYSAGVATGLDVTAALAARHAARANRVAVRYDRSVARARLERAAGVLGEGGFGSREEKPR